MDELVWTITWCRAFPTLCSSDVCCTKDDENNLKECLQLLAFDEIFFPNENYQRLGMVVASSCSRETKTLRDEKNAFAVCDNMAPQKKIFFSSSSVETKHDKNNSLGYGEIMPQAVLRVMNHQHVSAHLKRNDEKQSVVVDLGSGNGRVLFAAALAFPFKNAIGIEILPHLHQQALENLAVWQDRTPPPTTRFEFYCGDFCDFDISNASLVWVHATVFTEDLMGLVQKTCETCANGTLFVIVSKALRPVNGIVTITSIQLPMNWGEATVHIQQKMS